MDETEQAREKHTAPNGAEFDMMFVFSTERLASDGGVIRVDGWRWATYMSNPRFLSMHDISGYKAPTLIETIGGSSVWVGIRNDLGSKFTNNGKGLVGAVRFAATDFGRDLKLLYSVGDLEAVSVRWDWQTEEVRNPFEEEVQQYGDGLFWVATRTDLVEVSAVAIGADPGALALRGILEGGVPDMVIRGGQRWGIRKPMRAAYERCRAAGHELPSMTKLFAQADDPLPVELAATLTDAVSSQHVRLEGSSEQIRALLKMPPVDMDAAAASLRDVILRLRAEHPVDASALSDILTTLKEDIDLMGAWLEQGSQLRETFSDVLATLTSFTVSSELAIDLDDDDEDRSVDMLSREKGTALLEQLSTVAEAVREAMEPEESETREEGEENGDQIELEDDIAARRNAEGEGDDSGDDAEGEGSGDAEGEESADDGEEGGGDDGDEDGDGDDGDEGEGGDEDGDESVDLGAALGDWEPESEEQEVPEGEEAAAVAD